MDVEIEIEIEMEEALEYERCLQVPVDNMADVQADVDRAVNAINYIAEQVQH